MSTILLNAFGLFFIILIGFFLKKIGLVSKSDGKVLSTIIVTITLPATVIIGMNSMVITSDFITLAAIAIIMNLILVLTAKFLWRKDSYLNRVFFMYCVSGYNIGNFTLPFIQSFYPLALPYLFMFDVGNCIMIAGGSKILVESSHPDFDKKQATHLLTQTLLRSVTFMTYLIMVILRVFSVSLPTSAIDIFKLFSSANGFLSLLMIGIYLELYLPKSSLVNVLKILSWRYAFATLFAALFYFMIPFSNPLIKIVLTVLAFAPIPTFAVINSVSAGIQEEVTGFISSISILLSLGIMTVVMILIIGG